MKVTRDKWGAASVAVNQLAFGIVQAPHTIRGYVESNLDQAKQTHQVLYEQEMARQAAKKANRQRNRALIGTAVGMTAGGIGGIASGASLATTAGLMSSGSQIGSGLAGGDAGGIADGLGSLASIDFTKRHDNSDLS